MPSRPDSRPIRLAKQFKKAASRHLSNAAVVVQVTLMKGFEKAARLHWRLTTSKADKRETLDYAQHDADMHASINAERDRVEQEHIRNVNDFILTHPKAGNADAFANIGWPERAPVNAALAVGGALRGVSVMTRRMLRNSDAETAELRADGSIVLPNGDTRQIIIPEIRSYTDATEDQAKELWQWVYKLAESGAAPNVFAELSTTPTKTGLTVTNNTNFDLIGADDRYQTSVNLWMADKNAALAPKPAAAKPKAPKR